MWYGVKHGVLDLLVRLNVIEPLGLQTETLQGLECKQATVELANRYRHGLLRAMRNGEQILRAMGGTIPMAWIEEHREYYIRTLTELDAPFTHHALRMPDPISYIRIQSLVHTKAGLYTYMTHVSHENPLICEGRPLCEMACS